jgi:excisionase family DNA binding protein
MDIETRLAAIEEAQNRILSLLMEKSVVSKNMTLKEAAKYVGYSPDHFRRLAVEQRIIPFSRPSGQQKGKLLFRKADLDSFLDKSTKSGTTVIRSGRKRKSKNINFW